MWISLRVTEWFWWAGTSGGFSSPLGAGPAPRPAMLVRALSRLAFKASKDGGCTTSLCRLLQCSPVLTVIKLPLGDVMTLLLLNSHHHPVLKQYKLVFALKHGLHHQHKFSTSNSNYELCPTHFTSRMTAPALTSLRNSYQQDRAPQGTWLAPTCPQDPTIDNFNNSSSLGSLRGTTSAEHEIKCLWWTCVPAPLLDGRSTHWQSSASISPPPSWSHLHCSLPELSALPHSEPFVHGVVSGKLPGLKVTGVVAEGRDREMYIKPPLLPSETNLVIDSTAWCRSLWGKCSKNSLP